MLSVVNSTPSLVDSASSVHKSRVMFKLDRDQLMQVVQNQISSHREGPREEEIKRHLVLEKADDYAALQQTNYSYAGPICVGSTHQDLIRKNASVKRGNVSPYDRPYKLVAPRRKQGYNLISSKSTARLSKPNFGPSAINDLYERANVQSLSKTPRGRFPVQ